MANPTNNTEPPNTDALMNSKRRRKKSVVWDHFTIETIDAECTKARCMQCKKVFSYITGSKLAGTSHLKRHIALGICPVSRTNQKAGQLLSLTPLLAIKGSQEVNDLPRRRYKTISNTVSFYQDRCRHDIAKMIIMHEYPLTIVECPSFLNSAMALQPQFPIIPLDGIEKECVGIYMREKETLLNLINSINGRVNLSLDMWLTDQSVGYAFITGQFIDDDWKLSRRILGIVLLPFPESESAFNHAILSCISSWNLGNKLFAVTLDDSFANKAVRENVKRLLSEKNPSYLNGQLLIGSCYARVLGHLAQDSLWALSETVKKVRDIVKYVVTIEGIQERFNSLKLKLQVPSTKTLVLDDQNQWNTTYHMLVAACELKEVFPCLDIFDPDDTLTMDEWKELEILCTFLRLLIDAANILTGPTYPTANAFFHEVWKLQLELKNGTLSDDIFIRSLITPMYERFDRYWNDSFLVFSIAVVMDPRFKMKLVEFSFTRIYGKDDAAKYIKTVSDGLCDLFLNYVVQMLPPPTFVVDGNVGFEEEETRFHYEILKNEVNENEIFLSSGFELLMSEEGNMKTELDQYLEELVLPRMQEFDVLGWWKLNRKKYPTLSKMASDILCIPVSTVSQESVFDMRCKKMDRYRCSLRPSTVEALICAKDWLQYGSPESSSEYSPEYSPRSVVKMEL